MTILENPSHDTRRPPAPRELVDAGRYTSAEFQALEVERMWTRAWQLACLTDDLTKPGDFYEHVIGPYSVLIVRKADGTLRAHRNVCLHRGRRIKQGAGSTTHLRCPYHGWTWDLDGALLDVPERETFCDFADDTVHLQQVKVDTWQSWVFINLDPNAVPLPEYLAPVRALMEPYRFDRQFRWYNKSTVVRCNWKNALDAFLEGYHGRFVHPESIEFTQYADYPVTLLGEHSSMVIPLGIPDSIAAGADAEWEDILESMDWSLQGMGEDTTLVDYLRQIEPQEGQSLRELLIPMTRQGMEAGGIDVTALDGGQLVDDWHFHIFPNVIINSFSYGSWIFRMRPNGTDPNSAIMDIWLCHRAPDAEEVPSSVPHEQMPEGQSGLAVLDQDLRNLPPQQDGMRDSAYPGLRLSSLETRIVHLHDVIDRYLSV